LGGPRSYGRTRSATGVGAAALASAIGVSVAAGEVSPGYDVTSGLSQLDATPRGRTIWQADQADLRAFK
jgi:hypothetical protein